MCHQSQNSQLPDSNLMENISYVKNLWATTTF